MYDEPDALALQSPRSTRPSAYDDVAEVLGHGLQLNDSVANGNGYDGNGYDENVYDDVDPGEEHGVRYACQIFFILIFVSLTLIMCTKNILVECAYNLEVMELS